MVIVHWSFEPSQDVSQHLVVPKVRFNTFIYFLSDKYGHLHLCCKVSNKNHGMHIAKWCKSHYSARNSAIISECPCQLQLTTLHLHSIKSWLNICETKYCTNLFVASYFAACIVLPIRLLGQPRKRLPSRPVSYSADFSTPLSYG